MVAECVPVPSLCNCLAVCTGCFEIADFLEATQEHYKYAVNAAIVEHEFGTPEGSVHLAAAGIKPIWQQQPVPSQGCVPLQLLAPGCTVTMHTQPGPDPEAAAGAGRSSWGRVWGERSSRYSAAGEDGNSQQQWPGPEAVREELPKQDFLQALQQLSQASMLSQPRLLAAFGLYQACFANISHLQLVDTQMGELQRPVQLGAFLALQRLHLENMAEMLQTEWVMKVSSSLWCLWRLCSGKGAAWACAYRGVLGPAAAAPGKHGRDASD